MFEIRCPGCHAIGTLVYLVRKETAYRLRAFPSPTRPTRGTLSWGQSALPDRGSKTNLTACDACGWSTEQLSARDIIVQVPD